MFVKEYFILLVAASVMAFPIGYALMKKWLESYIEQTTISAWIYLAIFSGIGLLILLCIGWRVWQAAWQNPAEVIKVNKYVYNTHKKNVTTLFSNSNTSFA